MKNTETQNFKAKKVEELHSQSNQWKSNLCFLRDELTFINQLLHSYVFEPNTPNLFERLQNYQDQLKKVSTEEVGLQQRIEKHETDLGGMLETSDDINDKEYYNKHEALNTLVTDCLLNFRDLKSEIFNYAGGILKQRKPGT
ncbi:hypothetical protein [Muriicola sp. Z0-33]|uniref:hypothetical protein n=1 Tax=Muriicola sp. Z0-33 TaxID=2816957 RepID=UPI002237FB5F|nr:hypothetical protein [Muriicola sp. Z0-33]MCW5515762.1 hypothetical protein [Muriicola sp. Z0-33]